MRDPIGADATFMVDANCSMSVDGPIEAAEAFEPFDMYWFEEPTIPDDFTGYARIAEATDVPPGPCEIQIEVSYCGICGTDLHADHGHKDQSIGNHRIIGHEMSGRVSAVGENVTGFADGDAVVVRPLDHCGDCPACSTGLDHICHNLTFLGLDTDGGFQQKWTVTSHTVHKLPEGLPLAQAARQKCARVMITESNRQRLELARELGFDVLDPEEVDVYAEAKSATETKGYDVVFEVSGTQAGVDLTTATAAARERICMVAIHACKPRIDPFAFFWRELEVVGARVYERAGFGRAIDWLAAGIGAERSITFVRPLSEISDAFHELSESPGSMKTLIRLN